MPRNPHSIDHLSAATVRQAQGELAMLRRDVNKLRDGEVLNLLEK